MEPHLK